MSPGRDSNDENGDGVAKSRQIDAVNGKDRVLFPHFPWEIPLGGEKEAS